MIFLKVSLVASLVFANFAVAIWPIPASYEHGSEVVWIDRTTKWEFDCPNGLVGNYVFLRLLRQLTFVSGPSD